MSRLALPWRRPEALPAPAPFFTFIYCLFNLRTYLRLFFTCYLSIRLPIGTPNTPVSSQLPFYGFYFLNCCHVCT